MRAGKPAIVSDPLPPQSVLDEAGADRRRPVARRARLPPCGRSPAVELGRAQHALQRPRPIRRCAAPTSCSTPPACWPRSRRCASGCRSARRRCATGLATVELPGRFQVVPGEPTLVLDVAHNPHAVAALAQNLDQMGFFPRTHAVFGAMRDKDIAAILARMAPLVDPGTSPTCRRRARRRAGQLAESLAQRRAEGGDATVGDAREPARSARRARRPARTPLIESSSSARSTPWAACSRDGLPQRAGRHAA